MPLEIGSRLGSYIVSGTLGAGGMGEVYRASDSRLGRDVALKTLPDAFATDPERMARFEREARVLASLNHPHIAALYGIEESGGLKALVMELVEGPTLEDRLREGPLVIEDAVKIARQVADALEYAHERNVVHRDLKPANVKVMLSGMVKVLDFGLAKAAETRETSIPVNSPTLTMRATQAGVILGTAGYMSPEQASGKPVDKRSDIWSFGVLLYELLTGKALFGGETIAHTMADVLRAEVPFDKLPPSTPASLRSLLQRCLDRDLRTRLRDIGEARIALERYTQQPEAEPVGPEAPKAVAPSRVPWAIAAASLAVAAALGMVAMRQPAESPAQPIRFEVTLPERASSNPIGDLMAVSPDGRHLAYTYTSEGGIQQLWVRSLDSIRSQLVPGTNPRYPFWSPDSKYLAFTEGGQQRIRIVGLDGAPGPTITGRAMGGSWSRSGVILVGDGSGPLQQVSTSGGTLTPVYELDKSHDERAQLFPHFLPDGKHFLFVSRTDTASTLTIGTLGSSETRRIPGMDGTAVYADPGYLLFVRNRTLLAQPFDLAKLELTGAAVAIEQNVGVARVSAMFHAAGGTLATSSSVRALSRITVFNREGKALQAISPEMRITQFTRSPDGTRLAIEQIEPGAQLATAWLLELATGILSRVSPNPARDPTFSPTGKQLLFTWRSKGHSQLFLKELGGGPERVILESTDTLYPEGWLKDGTLLVTVDARSYGLLRPGEKQLKMIYESKFNTDEPMVSPDGKWVVFNATDSGRQEVYLARFPEWTDRRQLSAEGGVQPQWRQDGKEIVYLGANGYLLSVALRSGPDGSLEGGVPVKLFQTDLAYQGFTQQFAMSDDGNKFYVGVAEKQSAPPIKVSVNWAAGLAK